MCLFLLYGFDFVLPTEQHLAISIHFQTLNKEKRGLTGARQFNYSAVIRAGTIQ